MKNIIPMLIIISILLGANISAQDIEVLEVIINEEVISKSSTNAIRKMEYSLLTQDPDGPVAFIKNRIAFSSNINYWDLYFRWDLVSKTSGDSTGFSTKLGEFVFAGTKTFFKSSKGFAKLGGEFIAPASEQGFGQHAFTFEPAISYTKHFSSTYNATLKTSYKFSIIENAGEPDITIFYQKAILAWTFPRGMSFTADFKGVYDFYTEKAHIIISPIFGKVIGENYSTFLLAEIPAYKNNYDIIGPVFQFGFTRQF